MLPCLRFPTVVLIIAVSRSEGDQGTLWWNSEDEHRLNIGRLGKGVCTQVNPPWADAYQDTFRSMFAAIYADIAAGHPSENPKYPTFIDGHRNVAICAAAYRSANETRVGGGAVIMELKGKVAW